MKKIYIVVPTYDPDEKIMDEFINELSKEFDNILIVNDGSDKKHDKFFKSLEKKGLEVFNNYKNMGKGRAIKNAFNHILNKDSDLIGCITCDCDGQHTVKDIKSLYTELSKGKDDLIIGVRDFDQSDVPLRSSFGNKVTRSIFKNLIGLEITDTQTGLRAFSKKLMLDFIDLPGERYEYETNMLIESKKKNINIKEIIIDTVYINKNETSHFNPIKDSMKIYKLFGGNFFKLLISFVLNILLFVNLYKTINNIFALTYLCGFVSSIVYCCLSRKLLFNKRPITFYISYLSSLIFKLTISALCFVYLYNGSCILLIKILIDLVLGFVFYIINNAIKY